MAKRSQIMQLNIIDRPTIKLNIVETNISHTNDSGIKSNHILKLNIIAPITDHSCYILHSSVLNKVYIGYTIDFNRRLRQHNGEIKGGAKRTQKGRPWYPICIIKGFYDQSSALRFEAQLQYSYPKRIKGARPLTVTFIRLINVINRGDKVMPWPYLFITWYFKQYSITLPDITNQYI
jgi:predicted GIY-YIG superfamily endonuclease